MTCTRMTVENIRNVAIINIVATFEDIYVIKITLCFLITASLQSGWTDLTKFFQLFVVVQIRFLEGKIGRVYLTSDSFVNLLCFIRYGHWKVFKHKILDSGAVVESLTAEQDRITSTGPPNINTKII